MPMKEHQQQIISCCIFEFLPVYKEGLVIEQVHDTNSGKKETNSDLSHRTTLLDTLMNLI